MNSLRPFDSRIVTRPLKHIAALVGEKVDAVPAAGRYIGLEQIASWQGTLSDTQLTQQPEGAANVFSRGDVVFGKLRPYLAKAWVADTPGFCTTEGLVLRPIDGDSRFVRYCLLTNEAISSIDGSTYGSKMPRADWSFIGALHLPCPAPDEQERIANFLDDKTARIDALISEKERLIGSLDDYRLSVVSHAVSGGLIHGAQVTETRDMWFGALPQHWAFCPLNYRYEVQLGKMLDEKRITGDNLRPYLRNTDVQWGRINADDLPTMDISPDELLRYAVRPGDLLVCEGGDVGRAAIWEGAPDEIGYQKALHRVRPRTSSDVPKFLFYALFDSAKRGRFADREKATIAHLTAEAFRRYRFPFPPEDEQTAIVAYLDAQMSRLDNLRTHSLSHIDRLREYRSSLISAAVTGQLDVGSFEAAKA